MPKALKLVRPKKSFIDRLRDVKINIYDSVNQVNRVCCLLDDLMVGRDRDACYKSIISRLESELIMSRTCCKEALNGEWEVNNQGFQAMIDGANRTLSYARRKLKDLQ